MENISDQELFTSMMTVAGEEPEIGRQLTEILMLKREERGTLLDVLLHHTKLQLAPEELKRLFILFLNDDFARDVLHFLRSRHHPA